MRLPRNAGLFIAFRVLFNCRFYYPVYTVLFLDLGASMGEFAALNALWAVAIILLEVPSGALADQFGRKPLVVAAGVLMVLEMLLLIGAPTGGGIWLFLVLLVNRIASGAAEAAASGADEALAYDSITPDRRALDWPRVMARLTRAMALGFVAAMILGGVFYDAGLLNRGLAWIGSPWVVSKELAIRLPVLLNLLTACAALVTALCMTEPAKGAPKHGSLREVLRESNALVAATLRAGRWILREPAALLLILIGVSFDSVVRLFLTLASEFYRLIEIDPAWFGVIGGGVALLGFALSGVMERMAARGSPLRNFQIVAAMIAVGAASLFFAIPLWGVLLLLPLFLSIRFINFFLSHYLNEVTASEQRATVLSFRGVSMNLGYGLAMALFGLVSLGLPKLPAFKGGSPDEIFAVAIWTVPLLFLALGVGLVVFKRSRYRQPLDQLIEAARRKLDPPPGGGGGTL